MHDIVELVFLQRKKLKDAEIFAFDDDTFDSEKQLKALKNKVDNLKPLFGNKLWRKKRLKMRMTSVIKWKMISVTRRRKVKVNLRRLLRTKVNCSKKRKQSC